MVAITQEQAEQVLRRWVEVFNTAVRTGDFTLLVALFTEDAVVDFEGIPERGPIEGQDAIAAHYHENPPDDEIRVKRWKTNGDSIAAEFLWSDVPEAVGGCFFLEPRGGRISRLTVALGGPRCRFR